MYNRDERPRRPAIPVSFYALVTVLLAERTVTGSGTTALAAPEGRIAGALTAFLLVIAVAMLVRGAAGAAHALMVVAAALAAGLFVASLMVVRGSAFVEWAQKTPLRDADLVIVSDTTKKDTGYRCQALMEFHNGLSEDVWLTLPEDVGRGDRLVCVGVYEANTDDDWGRTCRMQGIWGSVRARRIEEKEQAGGLFGQILAWRQHALNKLCQEDTPQRALMAACALGSRGALKEQGLDTLFSQCGVAHLVAVSGSHLAVLSFVLEAAGERLGLRPRVRFAAVLCCTGIFVLVTGCAASAVRSWVMSAVSLTGRLAGRRGHGLSGVSLVGMAMAVVSPELSGQLGFLLSVVSVASLCLFSPYVTYVVSSFFDTSRLVQFVPYRVRRRLDGAITSAQQSVAASLVALLATLPLCAETFGEVSLVGPLSNLAVGMLFTPFVGFSMASCLVCQLPTVGALLVGLADACAQAIIWSLRLVASLPLTTLMVDVGSWQLTIGLALAAFVLLLWWPRVSTARLRVAAVMACGAAMLVYCRWRYFAPARICVLDIGQGDAILIQDGASALLVDAGPDDAIVAALSRNHVMHLDAGLVTHLHADHAAGFEELPQRLRPQTMLVAQGVHFADSKELSYGDTVCVGRFVLRMVSPIAEVDGDENSESVVLTVGFKEGSSYFCGLLTGDAEQDVLEQVLNRGDVGDVDFLKVGHHGSEVSLTAGQASRLLPEVSVASAGKNNRYGHPTSTCVLTLEGVGSRFLCTKDVGDVEIRLGEGNPRVFTQRTYEGVQ